MGKGGNQVGSEVPFCYNFCFLSLSLPSVLSVHFEEFGEFFILAPGLVELIRLGIENVNLDFRENSYPTLFSTDSEKIQVH